jgi:hypothetical protein
MSSCRDVSIKSPLLLDMNPDDNDAGADQSAPRPVAQETPDADHLRRCRRLVNFITSWE